MLMMPIKVLMALERFPPHQHMLRDKQLVAFDPEKHGGKVIFISHQWLGHDDPDSSRHDGAAAEDYAVRVGETHAWRHTARC